MSKSQPSSQSSSERRSTKQRRGKPPSRSNSRKRRSPKGSLFLLALAGVAGVAAWQGWSWWSWANAPVKANAEEDATVQLEIEPGTSAYQIGRQLQESDLIRSSKAWDLWVRGQSLQQKVGRSTGEFQAGIYELSPTTSMTGLAKQIREGDVIQAQFTVPEGWNMRQMAAYFESQGFFSAEEFLAVAQETDQIRNRFTWLPPNLPHLEGYLFPDTYQLDYTQVSAQSVVETMLNQFETQALPIYQAAATDMDLGEWVNFSSIVEKEAVVPSERTLIAGVLAHRLRIGKKLEVDPTVEYGLGITQTPDRTLTFAEVATPSPYNSYLNPGLPPTPIASPGVASLTASLSPEDTDYLFYVARYDGTHVFSRTFSEHLAAQDQIHDARDAKKREAALEAES